MPNLKHLIPIFLLLTLLTFSSTRILVISLDTRPFDSDVYRTNLINTKISEYERQGYTVTNINILPPYIYITLSKGESQ